jgi:hypothetical protein
MQIEKWAEFGKVKIYPWGLARDMVLINSKLSHCVFLLFRSTKRQRSSDRVKWDSMCLPIEEGGLGVKDLHLFKPRIIE